MSHRSCCQLQSQDIIAQSAWELGRLHKQQNKNKEAISNYTEAVNALKAIRTDLVAVNSDVQFSFRESVEPVYREFVELLLEDKPDQNNLVQARELIESLQIAELDNFLREACLDKAEQIDRIDVIVFLDGDRSDDPGQLGLIAGPVLDNQADLVIGSRIKGTLEKGAMPLHGRLGNRFIVLLLRLL